MLYLEDFLEVVENVPREVQEKTEEIRDLDIKVQSTSEQLEEQLKTFYSNAQRLKPIERSATFDKIKNQYYKLLESADEKVNIATSLHDSLERYIRRIDVEIEKFKCELEADSPGITEILERKSLELDEPSRESQKENRSYYSRGGMGNYLASDWRHTTHIKKEDSDPNLSSSLSLSPPASSNSLSYTLGHIPGAGGNAIAAAASQAIAATQQMRPGRRTASLAASFDAVSQGVVPADLSIGCELAEAAKAALAASSLSQDSGASNLSSSDSVGLSGLSVLRGNSIGSQSSSLLNNSGSATKRQKKNHRSTTVTREPSPQPSDDLPTENMLDPLIENSDWPYDPNEPRYCICNQVSYGNMVACDNRKCSLEWFHYACVGITAPPKGKWYCPQCSLTINRRQRK